MKEPRHAGSLITREPSAEGNGSERVFSACCCRCGAGLRIVDDMPPTTDITQYFRGTISDAYVVVPMGGSQEYLADSGSAGQEKQVQLASLDEVSRIEKIMEMASGQSDVDHPVCSDCLRLVVAEVQRQVDQANLEYQSYEEARNRLREQLGYAEGVDEEQRLEAERAETQRLESEIAQMEAEEQRLVELLASYDQEEAQLKQELEVQRQQELSFRREEEAFWASVSEYHLDVCASSEEKAATANAIQYATAELNRLKRTNVLNDMFHICTNGAYGTINGLRLGQSPENSVKWEEINAAWGQVVLLLDALVKKCGVHMTQYRLIPRGNYSAIQANNETLELHSGDGMVGRFLTDKKYDMAMCAFLACLRQVTRCLHFDSSTKLPFKIEDDKVGGFSVKLQFNQVDRWTKGLKFMLLDLKWIIALVQSREYAT